MSSNQTSKKKLTKFMRCREPEKGQKIQIRDKKSGVIFNCTFLKAIEVPLYWGHEIVWRVHLEGIPKHTSEDFTVKENPKNADGYIEVPSDYEFRFI